MQGKDFRQGFLRNPFASNGLKLGKDGLLIVGLVHTHFAPFRRREFREIPMAAGSFADALHINRHRRIFLIQCLPAALDRLPGDLQGTANFIQRLYAVPRALPNMAGQEEKQFPILCGEFH